MPQTKFAQILSKRRKELRLSIPQAAKVLRMRESVLEAFEAGDFERLPALGYAQGMIASYARYLGLDSRQITELYEDEHERYVRERTGRPTSGLPSLSDEPGHRGNARSVTPVRSPSTLSSQGSAYAAGAYGAGAAGVASAGGAASYAARSGASAGSRLGEPGSRYGAPDDSRAASRRYTTRMPDERDGRQRRQQAASARRARGADGARRPDSYDRYGSREDVTTRRVSAGQYSDDMRYDDGARPYRPSSTRMGREAARSISAPERPNVRRRSQPAPYRDPRARTRRQQSAPSGVAGALASFASNPQRVIALGAVVLSLVLVVILVASVRSCAAGSGSQKQVSVVTATTSATTAATTQSAAEQKALSEAAAKQAAAASAAASQETVVTVSVAKGSTTWVEIVNDGQQVVAENVTGDWSQEFTVTKSLTISVANSSAVTVEKNGERVQLTKTSGSLATATIEGSDPTASTTSQAESSSTTSTKSTKSGSSSSSGSGSSSSSSSSSKGTSTSTKKGTS